jgi:hypothetical protein
LPDLIGGRALLGGGRPVDALPLLTRAVASAKSAHADGTFALAQACAAQAAVLVGGGDARVQPHTTVVPDPEVAAIVAETAGMAALLRADARTAVVALDAAVQRWEPLGQTSWLARALSLRASALHATGDRTPAAASMSRARAVMDAVRIPARNREPVEHPLEDWG